MQFKSLFDFRNISRLLIFAVILFLSLPLIFPEKNEFKIINREKTYSHEDSPLPIFPKENLLDKYVNKLKKFYKMDIPIFDSGDRETQILSQNKYEDPIETNQTKSNDENVDITATDLFFSADYDDDIFAANSNLQIEQKDDSVNLQKGTVKTRDGLTLEPTQEGYYYNGKFYKNGTYPQKTNMKHIEGALNRYHSRVAKNLGKKALYFADENGNLTVSYVDNLPDQNSTNIDAYLAQNQRQNKVQNRTYQNTRSERNKYRNSDQNNDISYSDIARASIKDMHGAYNLTINKIQNGQMGQNIDMSEPLQNALVNNFLNNNNTPSNEIVPDKPNETPVAPSNSENSENVIAGSQDFAQEYADKIHELNCGPDSTGSIAEEPEPSQIIPAIGNIFQITGDSNAVSCDTAPLIVEQSSAITNNVSQNSDFERFTDELNQITNQSEKTDINIISTDRNFYPVASKLNNEESIRNSNNDPVTVHIIGPNENEADLSKVLENVTYSITDDISVADKLTNDLANYYALTQDENADTHTILAFPTDDEKQVFILADQNNSYWIKNPRQLENMPTQYMEKNGVYYKGIIVDKIQIGNLVNTEKTNLLYISDQNYTHYLPNGSALTTVKEEDVKINSLHPEQVQKNTDRVRNLTENGQKKLEKSQQKKQQAIEIIDLEKGNKKIQYKK